jgi:uncharacterized protein with WD repeat
MRIVDTIPHPQIRISIFSMNDKYLVKFEAGPYEQTYKFAHDDVEGIAGIKSQVTEDLLDEVATVFRKMNELNPFK